MTGSRQQAAAETRAGPGGIGAPVTQALTYLRAGHLIIWVNLSAALRATALLPESAGRLFGSSQRAVPARNLKGHSDMNAVQALVLWIMASDKEMSACIFHCMCYLIRERVPSYIKCLA